MRRAIVRALPRSIVSRYRIARYRARSRTNIDVAAGDRRWVRDTPDTFRVVGPGATSTVIPDGVVIGDVLGGLAARTTDAAADPVAAIVRARVTFRRFGPIVEEPLIEPLGLVVSRVALDEVGGVPAGSPAVAVYERLRDAGHRMVLVPVEGTATRPVRRDRIDRPSVAVLSLVEMHDVGGGGRGARIALELVRRGHHVTFVSAHGAVGADLGVRFIHPDLEQRPVWEFDPSELAARADDRALVLVEAPDPDLVAVAGRLGEAGYRVVYDIIDRWSDPVLGWDWYDPAVEQALVASADAVVASAPDLGAGPTTVIVPNAVDEFVFGGEAEPPPDLPATDSPLIGYHGSLYGSWFDWDALRRVAVTFDEAEIVVIGELPARVPDLPGNVHFLGARAHVELPAYLQRLAVGVVPFVVSDVSHAVSPLKVFEYLASGVPVAAPPLRAVAGIAGVHVADDLVDAVRAALAAPPIDREAALREHSWSQRCETLLELVGRRLDRTVDRPVTVALRPPVHWPSHGRSPGGRR